jgi:glycosyltransferase involved in cell wall biosynthesis
LEARKNLLFLLDAFAEYRKRGGSAALWCMGPVEQAYDVQLQRRARALGLGSAFRLKEATYGVEKWNIIRGSVAVVYPTKDEPFGRVPFEAVAAGTIPIVPELSGGAEYLQRFLPSCVYPQGDGNRLAQVLCDVEAAVAAHQDIGLSAARAWVAKELDWNRIGQQVFDLYSTLISPKLPDSKVPVAF